MPLEEPENPMEGPGRSELDPIEISVPEIPTPVLGQTVAVESTAGEKYEKIKLECTLRNISPEIMRLIFDFVHSLELRAQLYFGIATAQEQIYVTMPLWGIRSNSCPFCGLKRDFWLGLDHPMFHLISHREGYDFFGKHMNDSRDYEARLECKKMAGTGHYMESEPRKHTTGGMGYKC